MLRGSGTEVYKTGKGSRTQITPHRTSASWEDIITPPSVVLRLTGSYQGNRGPPPPPPLIGCLCWLRHMGLVGPGGPGPRAGQWQRLMGCHSAAEWPPPGSSPPPPRASGDRLLEETRTSGGDRQRGGSERRLRAVAPPPHSTSCHGHGSVNQEGRSSGARYLVVETTAPFLPVVYWQ